MAKNNNSQLYRLLNNEHNYLMCEDCGKVSKDVEWRYCPFEKDVNNTIVEVCICDECDSIRAADI